MDIDEFLDRELADLGLSSEADKLSGAEVPLKIPEAGDSGYSIKADLTKANLEQAEHSYHQLWTTLKQQKLKWDKDMYEELYILSRKFLGMLQEAHSELKNKSNRIYELIGRARNFIKEGKKDASLKAYAEMQEIVSTIPSVFFQEKRMLQEQTNDLYKEIALATDAELVRRVSAIMQEINQYIERIDGLIVLNDLENASSYYYKSIELYTQIPEGFLMAKNPLGMRLLDIYRSLSVSAEISNLKRLLSQQQPRRISMAQQQTGQHILQQPARKQGPEKMINERLQVSQPKLEKVNPKPLPEKTTLLNKKRELAKKNIKRGFYNEAWRNIEEALQLEPNDVESKALRAKIKTLQ